MNQSTRPYGKLEGRQRRAMSGRHLLRGLAGLGLASGAFGGAVALAAAGAAGAAAVHTGCSPASVTQSSGFCVLYRGSSSSTAQDLGDVAPNPTGTALTITTKVIATGAAPKTSFACLLPTSASQIDVRLDHVECRVHGGVFVPFSGGTVTIDLSQFPQFLDTQFSAQVGASKDATNPNDDLYYNNFTVSTFPALVQ